jgi:hypothetical protein
MAYVNFGLFLLTGQLIFQKSVSVWRDRLIKCFQGLRISAYLLRRSSWFRKKCDIVPLPFHSKQTLNVVRANTTRSWWSNKTDIFQLWMKLVLKITCSRVTGSTMLLSVRIQTNLSKFQRLGCGEWIQSPVFIKFHNDEDIFTTNRPTVFRKFKRSLAKKNMSGTWFCPTQKLGL